MVYILYAVYEVTSTEIHVHVHVLVITPFLRPALNLSTTPAPIDKLSIIFNLEIVQYTCTHTHVRLHVHII